MKLKDLVNVVKNKANKQVSFDIKKRILKSCDMNVDDLLNMKINKENKKFFK